MSLSKEYQDYHLTLKGWVMGSFKADSLGASYEKPIPTDRVMTISCYEELTSPHFSNSKPIYYDRVEWESEDKQLLKKLIAKWGDRPDWIGYK